ncbi:hypothetical protein ACIBH1_47070 [Nonomuraea sp. NPDC050663]
MRPFEVASTWRTPSSISRVRMADSSGRESGSSPPARTTQAV